MRGIVLRFDSFDALADELALGAEDEELCLSCGEGLRDGEWVLVTFAVGDESTAVAGCVVDTGSGVRLSFAPRDWEKLEQFVRGEGPSSHPPETIASIPCQIAPPPGVRVLVVDDDLDLQRAIKQILIASGFCADAVSSAEEALVRVSLGGADLLVLDWDLPGNSGLELCSRLRRDPRLCGIPVLMLTAHTTGADVLAAFAAGADDVVPKPFRALELGARVLGLLQRAPGSRALPSGVRTSSRLGA